MRIPPLFDYQWVNDAGNLSDSALMFMDELLRVMEASLSDNGWTVPQITASDLASISNDAIDGTMWVETDSNEFVIKINGSLRKVTTTAYP